MALWEEQPPIPVGTHMVKRSGASDRSLVLPRLVPNVHFLYLLGTHNAQGRDVTWPHFSPAFIITTPRIFT